MFSEYKDEQKIAYKTLLNAINNNKISHAYLFETNKYINSFDFVKKFAMEILKNNGYESYVVGGCVRDSLLGCTPEDWDITTSATPSQVKALFPKTFDTGIRHGTVTVLIDHTPFEVTTFRQDGDYVNHRTPAQVEFTTSIEEDLARRDFTVNAMAYNPSRGLVDPFGGQKDLEKSLLRCVGDANLRFTEDALRMLRAVRFSAQKGFDIEKTLIFVHF